MVDKVFTIGDFETQSGATLDLQLAYRVHGTLNTARDNLILFPTYYSGRSESNEYLIGPGMALNPDEYCIVIPNLFGNGVSSSPSNTPGPCAGSQFPIISYYDIVACQRRLIEEVFDAAGVKMVIGHSMGAMQAYQWAAQYPNMVERFVAICGSARTSAHNQLFLDSVAAALKADSTFNDGNYSEPPTRGLAAFSTVYAGWFASQKFYSEGIYQRIGLNSVTDVVEMAKGTFMSHDANDLLAMAATWRAGDICTNELYSGDFNKAMRAISAQALVMPCDSDLYFRLSDNEQEVALLADCEFAPIRSDFGHIAGSGRDVEAVKFINAKVEALLQR
jgi:homoserine O-acetyltransferase